jgi:hypothetical protein
MKRFVIIALLICLLIVSPALAVTTATLQDIGSEVYVVGGGAVIRNMTGGNTYIKEQGTWATNAVGEQMQYAGATCMAGEWQEGVDTISVKLYDSAFTQLDYKYVARSATTSPARIEVKISGGTAHYYNNGIEITNTSGLSINPTYIGFGSGIAASYWDDFQWGVDAGGKANVIGVPASNLFIVKDMINPAASGLAHIGNGTVVQANAFPITFGQGGNAIPPDAFPNANINLVNYATGAVYSSEQTQGYQSGVRNIPLAALFASSAPSGLYAVTIQGTGQYSEPFFYGSTGSSVAFDKDSYSSGDSASVSYSVSAGYWDTATYSYSLVVQDVFGNIIQTFPATTQTGTKSFSWTTSNPHGVYYALLKATKISDGVVTGIGFDSCDLTGYISFAGYANNAEDATVLTGVDIRIGQGAIWSNSTSTASGYTTSGIGFLTGSLTQINATRAGYEQYTYSFTPLAAKTIPLNITMKKIPLTISGIAIEGVVRDRQYGRPIPSVSVNVYNNSLVENYVVVTNNAGYYIKPSLTLNAIYLVNGSRSGYATTIPVSLAVTGS